MVAPDDQRLTDLEERYTRLEYYTEQLNEVITTQQGVIDRLIREVAELREAGSGGSDGDGEEAPPPHY